MSPRNSYSIGLPLPLCADCVRNISGIMGCDSIRDGSVTSVTLQERGDLMARWIVDIGLLVLLILSVVIVARGLRCKK